MQNPLSGFNPSQIKAERIIIYDYDDGPEDFAEGLPVSAKILKILPGEDRPDYHLVELALPKKVRLENGEYVDLKYLIIASRFEGQHIISGQKDLAIAVAYVTDESVLEDDELDFSKTEYAVIGICNVE